MPRACRITAPLRDPVALPVLDPPEVPPEVTSSVSPTGDASPAATVGLPGDTTLGYVHSHEATSALDGPGPRYVVWLTGCLMRCQYCHNPDTWNLIHGRPTPATEVLDDLTRYAAFLKAARGGFTVSGGEPLAQPGFTLRLVRGAGALGLHTALDTNGYLGERLTDDQLGEIDLFLLDLKSFLPDLHERVTGVKNDAVLRFARRLEELERPAWVRFVLVPGLTDDARNVAQLADFTATLGNVERVEVLPFHQMGRSKWDQLGMPYPLRDTPSATDDQVEAACDVFRAAGAPVA
ncbi:MAG: pyruvate formate-lyase-activating protein [Planctomycetota bacterium]